VGIDIGPGGFGIYDDHTAATIIWVIEIGIVPAIPHEVAIPTHIRISETQGEGRAAESQAVPISIGRISVSIVTAHAHRRRVVGIIGVIVVKIGPAGTILCLKTDILITGCSAVIFRLFPGCGVSSLGTTG
jgi:hypothetical protein